ncbi:MAG: Ig-like domain-containing protein [Planctomycetota bacterium]
MCSYNGTNVTPVNVTVTAHDNGGTLNGGVDFWSQTFPLIIAPVNNPPHANDQTVYTPENAPITVALTGSSGDPGITQNLTYGIVPEDATHGPYYGSLKGNNPGSGTISSAGTTVTGVLTSFPAQLAKGDVIFASGKARTVTAVGKADGCSDDNTLILLSAFTPDLLPGTLFTFERGGSVNVTYIPFTKTGSGTIKSSGTTVTGTGTSFPAQLAKGDVLLAGGQTRTVTGVGLADGLANDNTLTVSTAFAPDLTIATQFLFEPGAKIKAGSGTISSVGTTVTGVNTHFTSELAIGTTLIANAQGQVVTQVVTGIGNDISLTIAGPFVPDLAAATTFTYEVPFNDTFQFKITDDGKSGNPPLPDPKTSAPGTITIGVVVNDPPSFTGGPDQVVLENSATTIVPNWATSISPASVFPPPAQEASQSTNFAVSNDKNALFVPGFQPAVSHDGTLTFTPATDACGTAIVTVTLWDTGTPPAPSLPQTFKITVKPVNHAPLFTKGPDVAVLENASTKAFASWATNIVPGPIPPVVPGPLSEVDQSVHFIVTTNNTNLFGSTGQPAIGPDGTLTFTPALNQTGSATVTVVAQDDGGTANGGQDTWPAPLVPGPGTISSGNPNVFTVNGSTAGPQPGTISSSGTTVTGLGTNFMSQLRVRVGDSILANGQIQTVQSITNDSTLVTFNPFTPALAAGTQYFMVLTKFTSQLQPGDTLLAGGQTLTVNTILNDMTLTTCTAPQGGTGTISSVGTAVTGVGTNFATQLVPGAVIIANGQRQVVFTIASATALTTVAAFNPPLAGTAYEVSVNAPFNPQLPFNTAYYIQKTFTISVQWMNQPPSFTKGQDETVLRNAGNVSVGGWATNISPGPPDEVKAGQTVSFNVLRTDNNVAVLFTVPPAVASDGTLSFTPDDSSAQGTATFSISAVDSLGATSLPPDQVFNITIQSAPRTNQPPTANIQTVSVNENSIGDATVNPPVNVISLIGTDNNTKDPSMTMSYAILPLDATHGPFNGTLGALTQPAGPPWTSASLTYTPKRFFTGTDSFMFTVTDSDTDATDDFTPQQQTSSPAKVTISVGQVNLPPSFNPGGDVVVFENSGPYNPKPPPPQTQTPWATSISPVPADAPAGYQQPGQTVHFNIVNNSNPGLFSAGPAIDPTGNLTFTPTQDMAGAAILTVTLQNNGGTANGGQDTWPLQNGTGTITSSGTTVTGVGTLFKFGTNPGEVVPLFSIQAGGQTQVVQSVQSATQLTLVAPFPAGDLITPANFTILEQFTVTVKAINKPPQMDTPSGPALVGYENQTVTIPGNIPLTGILPGPVGATWEAGQTVTLSVTSNLPSMALGFVGGVANTIQVGPFATGGGTTVTPGTATIWYEAPANWFGTVTLTVNLVDNGVGTVDSNGNPSPGVSAPPVNFNLTINFVNTPPSFTVGPNVSTAEGHPVAAPLQYSAANWATIISAGQVGVNVKQFIVTNTNNTTSLFSTQPAVDNSGNLTFIPAPHKVGTANFTVALQNDGGTLYGGVDTSATQPFTITLTPWNYPPNATSAGGIQTFEGVPKIITLTGDDGNLELDGTGQYQHLTFTLVPQDATHGPFHGALGAITQPAASPWNTATVVYTPNFLPANGLPLTDTFMFTVADDGAGCPNGLLQSAQATVSLTVKSLNYPPSFTKGADQVVPENSPAQTVFNWATNILPYPAPAGSHPDQAGETVSFTIDPTKIVTTPVGSTTPTVPSYTMFSALSIDASGALNFTPMANTSGIATITVVATNNGFNGNPPASSAPQTFNITISPVNNKPIASAQSVTTNRNTPVPITLNGDDQNTPPLQGLHFDITQNPANGILSVITQPAAGTFGTAATVTYTPNLGYSGPDSFYFTVTDDASGPAPYLVSDPAMVSITVVAVAALPLATAQTLTATEGASLPITLSCTDPDQPPPAFTYKITPPVHGTLTLLNASTGAATYNSGPYHGQDSFTFTVTATLPGLPAQTSAPATVTINVLQANIAPTAASQVVNTNENTAVPITLQGDSGNPDDVQVLTFTLVTQPLHGTLSAVTQPIAAPWNTATVTYTPNTYYHGPDSFTFTVTDDANAGLPPNLTSAPAPVVINVAFVHQPPVATSQSVVTGYNLVKPITLLAMDPQSEPLVFAVVSPPVNGTLSGIGSALTYTPNIGYVGPDSFTFTATDAQQTSAPATVTITVGAPPSFQSPPVVTPTIVVAGQPLTVQANAGTATVTWDFGDGTVVVTGNTATHTYAAPGYYTITATATSPEGAKLVTQLQFLVGLPTVGNVGVQPNLGILVGGTGLSAKVGGKATLAANYAKRSQTTFSGAVGLINFPPTLQQSALTGQTGLLTVGQGALAQTFVFTLDKKGSFKATGVPGLQLNVAKKTFSFKVNARPGLTDLFESLGGWTRGVKKGPVITMDVPVTLQVDNTVFLSLTFRLTYQQIRDTGKGALAKK